MSINKKNTLFVLGAGDPEMEIIENIIKDQGCSYAYAMKGDRRVKPFEAYNGDYPSGQIKGTVVFVECKTPLEADKVVVVDHHKPGDPGFGLPPEKAWEASSLGQIYNLLGLEPDTYMVTYRGRFVDPKVVAAADHCLSHAYRGKVPGVSPEELLNFRAYVQAHYRGITLKEWYDRIEHAKTVINRAMRAKDFPGVVKDLRQVYRLNGPVDLANEATAILGIAILYEMDKGDRIQVAIIGASPRQVEYFKEVYAKREGLTAIYGDPQRGFAGGYIMKRRNHAGRD